jgi:regulator of sirC expression with transglutaminase-like and TPR domain
VDTLKYILQQPVSTDPLDLPALEMVRIEDPTFVCEPALAVLDGWADEIRQGPIDSLQGSSFVRELNGFFFDHLGFHGNEEDYFNPANSFLNVVMESRKGIPITLSVLYIELARRLRRKVLGIGFPGHFLVQVRDGEFTEYVDVFGRGRILSKEDCMELGIRLTGLDYSSRPEVLAPVDTRLVLIRMLNNLRGIYITRKANRKLLYVLDLLLLANPDNAEEYFTRAMVKMNLHQHASAERDLLHFLQLSPEHAMKDEVSRQLELARVMRSQMN